MSCCSPKLSKAPPRVRNSSMMSSEELVLQRVQREVSRNTTSPHPSQSCTSPRLTFQHFRRWISGAVMVLLRQLIHPGTDEHVEGC